MSLWILGNVQCLVEGRCSVGIIERKEALRKQASFEVFSQGNFNHSLGQSWARISRLSPSFGTVALPSTNGQHNSL